MPKKTVVERQIHAKYLSRDNWEKSAYNTDTVGLPPTALFADSKLLFLCIIWSISIRFQIAYICLKTMRNSNQTNEPTYCFKKHYNSVSEKSLRIVILKKYWKLMKYYQFNAIRQSSRKWSDYAKRDYAKKDRKCKLGMHCTFVA